MSRYRLTSLTALVLLFAACGAPPAPVEDASAPLAAHFEVLGNQAELTLRNQGPEALGGGWELYFNFGRKIPPESLPDTVEVSHVNGDLFRMTPGSAFSPVAPGESLHLAFETQILKQSDAPAGMYLVREGRAPQAVEISIGRIAPPEDLVAVPTAASRFERDRGLSLLAGDDVPRILPTPVRLERGEGSVTLDATWRIYPADGLEAEASYLAGALEPLLGAAPTVAGGGSPEGNAVVLEVADLGTGPESYRLRVAAGEPIHVTGADAAGVFYGIQSLRALTAPGSAEVPAVLVEDAPRFHYRGMHLDVARNFQSKASVLKLLDLMAFYKLNKFHFHLTDDEGWRLAIDGLPELVAVGSRRGHTTDESDRLLPSYGSGPEPDVAPGSGHFSHADFVEILRYATARHIEVIPEIDVPGHARAAIKAMEARGDAEVLLSDPEDASEYMSVQMWKDNVMNVCLPSTYEFLRRVVDAVAAMYAEAGAPLTAIHTGGDEVPHGVWERSPACERLIAAGTVGGVEELPAYFLSEMAGILAERGLVTAGWEEIALHEEKRGERTVKTPNKAFVGKSFRPYIWNNVWGWGAEDLGYQLANAGYEVVLSNVTNLYFDLAYDKDPAEPGYYWGGFVNTRKPWEFVPYDLFQNGTVDLMGRPIDPATYKDRVRLTAAGRENVLGIQGQLWSENVRSQSRMEYMAFPKLLGLAERAWAPRPAWATEQDPDRRGRLVAKDWNRFANRLGQRELPRLDRLYGGVGYRLPPPGGVIEDGKLLANVAFPGLAIRYTTDGTEPTAESALYEGPLEVSGEVRVRSFDTRGRGSRTSAVSP